MIVASEHLRRRQLPHLERGAAAAVRSFARRPRCTPRTSGFIRKIGAKGTELTGYPSDLRLSRISLPPQAGHRRSVRTGSTTTSGMFSWVVEIWSPMREAGIDKYLYIDWFRDHPIDDDLKLFRWNEAEARRRRARRLEAVRSSAARARSRSAAGIASMHSAIRRRSSSKREVARFPTWLVWQALLSAEARARDRDAERIGQRHLARTTGRTEHGMAAELRQQARARAQSRARRDGAKLLYPTAPSCVSGKRRDRMVGQLEGKAYKHTGDFVLAGLPCDRRPCEDRVGRARQGGRP